MDTTMIPLFRLNNKREAEAYHAILDELLESEYWAFGPKTAEFEKVFCEKFGHKHAIGVSNGTAAIQLVLSTFKAQQVFLADTTFVGVWNAVVNTKTVQSCSMIKSANWNTWDVTTKEWLNNLHTILSPTVVIVTHLYGSRSDTDIAALKALGNVIVIEDMSQCHGLKHSPYSDAQIYSMYPTKNVGALGEAGVITTDNPRLAEKFKSNSFYGYNANKTKVNCAGSNYKMDELQAAFLTHKLTSGFTDHELSRRRAIATTYNGFIGMTNDIYIPPFSQDATYHLYPICVLYRKRFRDYMSSQNIQTGCHYDHSVNTMVHPNIVGNTSPWNSNVVTLPMGGWLKQSEIERVVNAVNGYVNESK